MYITSYLCALTVILNMRKKDDDVPGSFRRLVVTRMGLKYRGPRLWNSLNLTLKNRQLCFARLDLKIQIK